MSTSEKKIASPTPLFDSLEFIEKLLDDFPNSFQHLNQPNKKYELTDIKMALKFLNAYRGSVGTFNSYRREIERLIHWSSLIAQKTLSQLKREDIEAFVRFCLKPPITWIGKDKLPGFIKRDAKRQPNPLCRPFVVSLPKIQRRKGASPDIKNFELSHGAVRELFAILSSFYNYLLQEEYANINPIPIIRQKSKFIRKSQGQPKIRRLSDLQWQTVIKTAEKLAVQSPESHERTLFIMSALYGMYLRNSELSASTRWMPLMNHFFRDADEQWWFSTVGKGNKERQIAVSQSMLDALKRWRKHLGLTVLPSPSDNIPLLPKNKGKGAIKSTNAIRKIVQHCFETAIIQLEKENFMEEAESLNQATVHWLRHTGISDDVKIRPREHVRDDAGHSSSAITHKYIDIELKERHRSAQKKVIIEG